MNLANKQMTFHKPRQVSTGINEGIRALAENYAGNIQLATDHCVTRVQGLTEAKLTRARAQNPPRYTRDGQSFVTLVWVLLVDGVMPQRKLAATREWLLKIIQATDLFEDKLTDADLPTLIEIFVQSIRFNEGVAAPASEIITRTFTRVWAANPLSEDEHSRNMPILNRLFIGRDRDVEVILQRLGIEDKSQRYPLTIVRGWPGVGKTALVNAIAHHENVKDAFADGLLWSSVGRDGDIFSLFKNWARQLGALHLLQIQHLGDLADGLRPVLRGRDIFILTDDIWTEAQGMYVKSVVDLKANTLLLTTRFTDVANALQDLNTDIYVLNTLSEQHATELLTILAPEPVRLHHKRIPELIKVLEGLPLALRVAGPTLQHYHNMHFDIDELIDDFVNDYNRLLESTAPGDRFDEATGQTPTIALLFKRSVETLSPEAQDAFIGLGVFKHKPATFNLKALQEVWEAEDARRLVALLIGRGLMEARSDKRYWVHQTLHMYANKLLDNLDEGLGS